MQAVFFPIACTLVKAVNVSSERCFSLLIPGLLGPVRLSSGDAQASMADDAHPALGVAPALETLLARADRAVFSGDVTQEMSIFHLFDMSPPAGADLPVAAITRLADGGEADDAWWLRADPVSLLPQGDGLLLQPADDLGLTLIQARALVDEILQVFGDDGWHLEAPVAHRWYLRPTKSSVMQTTPLAQVTGRDIHPYLPAGKDAKAWHVAMNEIQILLHTAEVNVERESRGQVPINSLWFWGGGQRPTVPPATWNHLWSDEVLSRGLAIVAGLTHSALPKNAGDWLAQATAGRHLLVMDSDILLARTGGSDAWPELEQTWIAPLVAAVNSGDLGSVTLHDAGGRSFYLTRKGLGRWWRRRRALGHYQ